MIIDKLTNIDYLIENQVIVPSILVLIISWLNFYFTQRAENDENFITLKMKFTELWKEIGLSDNLLNNDYAKLTKNEKYKVFLVIEFFCVVWFLNIRKKSLYSKEWKHNIEHVFKYKVMQTAFHHLVVEERQAFNKDCVKYMQKVITKTNKNPKV